MDAELLRAFSALSKAKKKSRPEDLELHRRLDRVAHIRLIKGGFEGSDYLIQVEEFVPVSGQTFSECLQEDLTWLDFYRRTKDAEHA